MYRTYSMELAGRTLTIDVGRMAAQANGAVLIHMETQLCFQLQQLQRNQEKVLIFPLSVDYEEKLYSVGKIPGGFIKREGRASENAVLASRLIDRPMRPLFPGDYRNDVTLNNLVLSVDQDNSPSITACLGSVFATLVSDIPFYGPMASTQIGLVDGEFVVNPTSEQREVSDLELVVSSIKDKVVMIEAGGNEIPEEQMIAAIAKAQEVNEEIIKFMEEIVEKEGKSKT